MKIDKFNLFRIFCIIIFEVIIINFSLFLAFIIRFENYNYFNIYNLNDAFLLFNLFYISSFLLLRNFRQSFKYFSIHLNLKYYLINFLNAVLLFLISLQFENIFLPKSISIIFLLVFSIISVSSRYILSIFLRQIYLETRSKNKRAAYFIHDYNSLNYFDYLINVSRFKIVFLFSDKSIFTNRFFFNLKVFPFSELEQNLVKYKVDNIFCSKKKIKTDNLDEIFKILLKNKYRAIDFKNDLDLNNELFNSPSDAQLLDKKTINKNLNLKSNYIKNKVVLITGCGGTIGKNLLKYILELKPKLVIALDSSEISLFNSKEQYLNNKRIVWKLIDIKEKKDLLRIFEKFKIDIIFHTAAYKHVDLAEDNASEVIKNNFFGTKNITDLFFKFNCSKFVFISTDKAVKPTNVMGASKLLCEQYLRSCGLNENKKNKQIYIVRFGNVASSSGSALTKFREKINEFSSIEVRHKDATRYFMIIEEAAKLVIFVGSLNKSNNIYALDMGKPYNILEITKKMINLSGLRYTFKKQKKNFIQLKITNLKKGEKLHEEVFLGRKLRKIHENQSIYTAEEPILNYKKLKKQINFIKNNLENFENLKLKKLIMKIIK
jgi:FlaA1/EpsC-like NDP-sugar epimerase